jgi:2-keto-3-deoxy-L-rhamnonate aldolase RhmA
MATAGWDSVTVDLQHGVQDYMSLVHCFQAMQAHPLAPMSTVGCDSLFVTNGARAAVTAMRES